MRKVSKNIPGHWGKRWQSGTTEDIVSCAPFKIDKSSCSPTPEQSFLFDLWTSCEQIQDSIYDQSSSQYQLLEILNPLLFETWMKSGNLKMAKSKARSTSKSVKSYKEELFEKCENMLFNGDEDDDLRREMSRTFGIIETMYSVGNEGGELFGIYIYQKDGKMHIRSGKIKHIPPLQGGDL